MSWSILWRQLSDIHLYYLIRYYVEPHNFTCCNKHHSPLYSTILYNRTLCFISRFEHPHTLQNMESHYLHLSLFATYAQHAVMHEHFGQMNIRKPKVAVLSQTGSWAWTAHLTPIWLSIKAGDHRSKTAGTVTSLALLCFPEVRPQEPW